MNALKSLPKGVEEALAAVERFDAALLHGFARLDDEQQRRLQAFSNVFTGSPLESSIAEAVAAVGRSEFVARSFLALAGGRVALLGSVHDALVAQLHEVLGRSSPSAEEPPPSAPGGSAAALAGVQQWLSELAIGGLKHLEESTVAPFAATLQNIQADPELTGLAALLTGFANELLRSAPAAKQPSLPAFRWSDFWSAAMVRTQQSPGAPTFREATGTLTPLGLDVQSHENFIAATLYGLFDDGAAQTVRVPFTSFKVDVIAGAEAWDLFEPLGQPILEALAERKSLSIQNAELRSNGDLVLRAPPQLAGPADPFAAADKLTSLPPPPALLRHPVHIAEPAKLPADHGLPIATERLPPRTEFGEVAAVPAGETIALLRFDRGGWRVQPLCVRLKKGFKMNGDELLAARKKLKRHSLGILKERASRLLRTKA